MHQKVTCTKCHTSLIFKNVSKHCADCHADIHRRQFGANCESCHSVKGWQVSLKQIRDHQNRFPLIGAHALLQCEDCHKNARRGQFTGLSTACYSCHQKDFQTPVLDHVSAGFPTTCESCHTVDTWFNAKFDHLKFTGYALTGAHVTLPCTACHLNNVFKGTPANCYACHTTDFASSKNPPHVQLGLPHDCGTCHSTINWLNAKFDHALYANYPLTGDACHAHLRQCHTNNNYVEHADGLLLLPSGRLHRDNQSESRRGRISDRLLHSATRPAAGAPSTFNHSTTSFPLTGAHITVACAQCHTNNNYTTLPTTCYGCHQADFNGTNNPPHVSAGFPTDLHHSATTQRRGPTRLSITTTLHFR